MQKISALFDLFAIVTLCVIPVIVPIFASRRGYSRRKARKYVIIVHFVALGILLLAENFLKTDSGDRYTYSFLFFFIIYPAILVASYLTWLISIHFLLPEGDRVKDGRVKTQQRRKVFAGAIIIILLLIVLYIPLRAIKHASCDQSLQFFPSKPMNAESQALCLADRASNESNIMLCEKADDRARCYLYLSQTINDPSLCEKVYETFKEQYPLYRDGILVDQAEELRATCSKNFITP